MTLEERFKKAIIDLELISNVRAARIGSETARLKPGHSPPRGMKRSRADVYRWLWQVAKTVAEREKVVKAAEEEVRETKFSPEGQLVKGTLDWKIAVGRDTRPVNVLTRVYGVSRTQVYRYRRRFGGGSES